MHGLWAEALILGRSLMELEIIIKWLLSEKVEERLNQYIGAILDEEKRLARKMEKGVSVSAQILSELIGDKLLERIRDRRDTEASETLNRIGSKSRWPNRSVREIAKEVDLERNYDMVYWIESIFAHAHPLSILEDHPSDWDHLLCPLFTCEARDGLPRALCLVAFPASILHVFSIVNDALSLRLDGKIKRAWKAVHAILRDESSGIRWEPSDDLQPGELIVYGVDGKVKRYSPKRGDDKPGAMKPKYGNNAGGEIHNKGMVSDMDFASFNLSVLFRSLLRSRVAWGSFTPTPSQFRT